MDDIMLFLLNWGPTMIFIPLCIIGIALGLRELSDTLRDIESTEDDPLDHVPLEEDPRIDAAEGNFRTAWKNVGVQFLFFLLALVVAYFKVKYPANYDATQILRAILAPAIFITGESLLVAQIQGIRNTRNKIRMKARKILVNKQEADEKLRMAESGRVTAEEGRVTAESERVEAEKTRKERYDNE